jgi:hypothetical protein
MQYNPQHLNSSDFGLSKSIFDRSNQIDNQQLAQLFLDKIAQELEPIIDNASLSTYSTKFYIRTKFHSEYSQYCYQGDKLILQKFLATGIVIKFNTFQTKTHNCYNCISIFYTGEGAESLPINITTLIPDFEVLIFVDFESVVFAINKILREVFYQPMIDRMAAQRIPIILYREAVMGKKKNSFSNCLVLGSKGRSDIVRKIAEFLGDPDVVNCF